MTPDLMENQENKKMFEIHEVENTPFAIIEKQDGCIIVLGQNQADETIFKSVEEAKKYINKKPWKLILVAGMILTQNMLNNKK